MNMNMYSTEYIWLKYYPTLATFTCITMSYESVNVYATEYDTECKIVIVISKCLTN